MIKAFDLRIKSPYLATIVKETNELTWVKFPTVNKLVVYNANERRYLVKIYCN